jgi:hypothetical protein
MSKQIILKGAGVFWDSVMAKLNLNFTELYDLKVPYTGATDTLQLKAGNASAAPVKFTSGALLTTVSPGVIEYDATRFYASPVTHRRVLSMASDSMISTVTATTVEPTVLWTGVMNATEPKISRVYIIRGCGTFTTINADDQVTVSVKLAGVTLVDVITPKAVVTNKPFSFLSYLTIRTLGVNGTISTFGSMEAAGINKFEVDRTTTIDTTTINNIQVLAEWSGTGNNLKLSQCWLGVQD